jgi:hypothetical protein
MPDPPKHGPGPARSPAAPPAHPQRPAGDSLSATSMGSCLAARSSSPPAGFRRAAIGRANWWANRLRPPLPGAAGRGGARSREVEGGSKTLPFAYRRQGVHPWASAAISGDRRLRDRGPVPPEPKPLLWLAFLGRPPGDSNTRSAA